jgi:hypothetical protein
MKEVASGAGAAIAGPPRGQALVMFMRPSSLGFAVASSVFEIGGDRDAFVGIVPAKKKLAYVTRPGTTRFMVVSEAADFLEAELEAGKTYYVLVTPRMGVWKARFSLRPVHAADRHSAEFEGWLSECSEIDNTPDSLAWAMEHRSDIEAKKTEYLPKWEKRSDRPRLLAGDGSWSPR